MHYKINALINHVEDICVLIDVLEDCVYYGV